MKQFAYQWQSIALHLFAFPLLAIDYALSDYSPINELEYE